MSKLQLLKTEKINYINTPLTPLIKVLVLEFINKYGDFDNVIHCDKEKFNYDSTTAVYFYYSNGDYKLEYSREDINAWDNDCGSDPLVNNSKFSKLLFDICDELDNQCDKVKLNNEYTAEFDGDELIVGCQTFPLSIIDKLAVAKEKYLKMKK